MGRNQTPPDYSQEPPQSHTNTRAHTFARRLVRAHLSAPSATTAQRPTQQQPTQRQQQPSPSPNAPHISPAAKISSINTRAVCSRETLRDFIQTHFTRTHAHITSYIYICNTAFNFSPFSVYNYNMRTRADSERTRAHVCSLCVLCVCVVRAHSRSVHAPRTARKQHRGSHTQAEHQRRSGEMMMNQPRRTNTQKKPQR